MNKKGFTTVELILTLAIVMVVMATILGVTYNYRDQSSYEQTVTDMDDYKKNITKIIYDDIFDIRKTGDEEQGKVISIRRDTANNYKYILTTTLNVKYNLEIINQDNKVGLKYGLENQEIEYIIPGSDKEYITFDNDAVLRPDDGSESDLYVLDIPFYNKKISKQFKIHLLVSK